MCLCFKFVDYAEWQGKREKGTSKAPLCPLFYLSYISSYQLNLSKAKLTEQV